MIVWFPTYLISGWTAVADPAVSYSGNSRYPSRMGPELRQLRLIGRRRHGLTRLQLDRLRGSAQRYVQGGRKVRRRAQSGTG